MKKSGFWSLNIVSQILTLFGLLSLFQSEIDLSLQLKNLLSAYHQFWYLIWDYLVSWTGWVLKDFVKDILAIWAGLALSFRHVLESLAKKAEPQFWREQYMTESLRLGYVSNVRTNVFTYLLRQNTGTTSQLIMRFFDYLLAPIWYVLLIFYVTFSKRARNEGKIAVLALANILIMFMLVIGINHYLKVV